MFKVCLLTIKQEDTDKVFGFIGRFFVQTSLGVALG